MKQKKTVLLALTAVVAIAVSVFSFLSCDKIQEPDFSAAELDSLSHLNYIFDSTEVTGDSNQISLTQVPLTPAANCADAAATPAGCNNFVRCARKIIPSGMSRHFTINWTNCAACGSGVPAPTTGWIAFSNDCDYLNVHLNQIPACFYLCYTDAYCFKAKLVCGNGSFSLEWANGDQSQQITITGDPHIYLKCEEGGVSKSCDGDLTWN